MTRQRILFVLMWVAAIAAMVFIWIARAPDEQGRQIDEGSSPVHVAGENMAPQEPRADLPVADPTAGPPRMFRGDSRHTGRSPFLGPSTAELAWSAQTGGRITGQAVVGQDGRVVVGSHDHKLYSFSSAGQEMWKQDLGGEVYSTPIIDDEGRIYAGSDGDAFFCLRPSGAIEWRLATDGDADTGAAFGLDGTIYFGAGNFLYAVNRDGTVKWRFASEEKIFTSPAVDQDGTIYIGSQDDHVYAITPDGQTRWSYETHDDNDSSLVIGDDGTIFFGSDDKHVYALTRDGELKWATDLQGYIRAPTALTHNGGLIAAVFGPRPRVVALDAETGDIRWFFPLEPTSTAEAGISSGPLVDRAGNIYVGGYDDYLYALAPTGDLRWIFEARSDVDAPPVLGPNGMLYVGSDDHTLYAIEADPQ